MMMKISLLVLVLLSLDQLSCGTVPDDGNDKATVFWCYHKTKTTFYISESQEVDFEDLSYQDKLDILGNDRSSVSRNQKQFDSDFLKYQRKCFLLMSSN